MISLTLLSENAGDQGGASNGVLDASEALALTGRVFATIASYGLLLILLASPLLLGWAIWFLIRRHRRGY